MSTTSLAPDRLLSAAEVERLVPYSERQLRRLEAEGAFPRRCKAEGGRKPMWPESEVVGWIEGRKKSRGNVVW